MGMSISRNTPQPVTPQTSAESSQTPATEQDTQGSREAGPSQQAEPSSADNRKKQMKLAELEKNKNKLEKEQKKTDKQAAKLDKKIKKLQATASAMQKSGAFLEIDIPIIMLL